MDRHINNEKTVKLFSNNVKPNISGISIEDNLIESALSLKKSSPNIDDESKVYLSKKIHLFNLKAILLHTQLQKKGKSIIRLLEYNLRNY